MPSTYSESGTVASEMFGASVAPMIEPVAKITAPFAPVSACAAASRTTLALTRASLANSSLAVTSIMSVSESRPWSVRPARRHYQVIRDRDQPAPAGAGHAYDAHWTEQYR